MGGGREGGRGGGGERGREREREKERERKREREKPEKPRPTLTLVNMLGSFLLAMAIVIPKPPRMEKPASVARNTPSANTHTTTTTKESESIRLHIAEGRPSWKQLWTHQQTWLGPVT